MKAVLLMQVLVAMGHLLFVLAITEDDFYEIGPAVRELPRGDDIIRGFTVTDPPFTFYNMNYTKFFVSVYITLVHKLHWNCSYVHHAVHGMAAGF